MDDIIRSSHLLRILLAILIAGGLGLTLFLLVVLVDVGIGLMMVSPIVGAVYFAVGIALIVGSLLYVYRPGKAKA